MPELPELEALRMRLGPRLEGALVTAAETNPKKGFMLRYPVEEFERELPVRRFTGVWRRGKHLGFDLELAGGGAAGPRSSRKRSRRCSSRSPPSSGEPRRPSSPTPTTKSRSRTAPSCRCT